MKFASYHANACFREARWAQQCTVTHVKRARGKRTHLAKPREASTSNQPRPSTIFIANPTHHAPAASTVSDAPHGCSRVSPEGVAHSPSTRPPSGMYTDPASVGSLLSFTLIRK